MLGTHHNAVHLLDPKHKVSQAREEPTDLQHRSQYVLLEVKVIHIRPIACEGMPCFEDSTWPLIEREIEGREQLIIPLVKVHLDYDASSELVQPTKQRAG